MIYLSGCVGAIKIGDPRIGVMLAYPHRLNPQTLTLALTKVPWAADNGCYAKGDRFNLDAYLASLDELQDAKSTCLFVTSPDVMGDAMRTEDLFNRSIEKFRLKNWPVAYVAQNGIKRIPESIDYLFIGGTTDFKLSKEAMYLTKDASSKKIPVHMGRVNSARRMRYAYDIGCKTVDGTHLRFAPDVHAESIVQWLDALSAPIPSKRFLVNSYGL